jgi:hypothetical protein
LIILTLSFALFSPFPFSLIFPIFQWVALCQAWCMWDFVRTVKLQRSIWSLQDFFHSSQNLVMFPSSLQWGKIAQSSLDSQDLCYSCILGLLRSSCLSCDLSYAYRVMINNILPNIVRDFVAQGFQDVLSTLLLEMECIFCHVFAHFFCGVLQ